MSTALKHKMEHLRGSWMEIQEKLQKLEEEQQKTRRLAEQFRRGKLIPFSSLADVSPNNNITLAPGVTCYRLPTEAHNHLAFITEFDAQALLRSHFHDCVEIIQMLRGQLIDFKNAERKISERTSYDPMQEHELYSPEGCLCVVYFQK